jgi:hypothetical protein
MPLFSNSYFSPRGGGGGGGGDGSGGEHAYGAFGSPPVHHPLIPPNPLGVQGFHGGGGDLIGGGHCQVTPMSKTTPRSHVNFATPNPLGVQGSHGVQSTLLSPQLGETIKQARDMPPVTPPPANAASALPATVQPPISVPGGASSLLNPFTEAHVGRKEREEGGGKERREAEDQAVTQKLRGRICNMYIQYM